MTDAAAPTWTILIPTLGERHHLFQRLMSLLMPQVDAAGGQVQVRAYWNNGAPGLPEIRQRLIEAVSTDYVSFIDDDDMVPADFVRSVLAALEHRPDYVGWQVEYFAAGKSRGIVDHSLEHGGWREDRNPYRLVRDISHINPMRTDVAKRGDFRVVRAGEVEDRPWVTQIRETGLLKTEVYIPRVMYSYFWNRNVSRWQNPRKIKQGFLMTPIDSPYFRYFDEVTDVQPARKLPEGARLGVIIPTRGRPQNIVKVIAAWDETNAWADADMILAIDADDPANFDYMMFQSLADPVRRIYVHESAEWTPMVPKLNRAASELTEGYFALGFAGDDHLPRTKGWARMYLDALGELGSGMVYGDDGYQGAKLSTEWAVTSDVVRALGRMVPAPVDHLYCDNAMMDVFGGAGALRHLPEVRIEHMHPVAGKASSDAQYEKVNSRTQYDGDRRAYERWKRTDLASQAQIIRGLRGEVTEVARPRPTLNPISRANRAAMKNVRSGPSSQRRRSRGMAPRELRKVVGATPDEIGVTLADLARNVPADQAIVELGVYQARTALLMAWGAGQGNGARVYGIDPWDLPGNVYDPPFTDTATREQAFHNITITGYTDRVTLIHGMSQDVVTTWTDRPRVGLLFVDGDHTYEGAKRDIEAWAKHLADGAVIAVDDYGHPDWPGVAQAVDELVDNGLLKPIQLFHDRLAVTALASPATTGEGGKDGTGAPAPQGAVTAITSEGVASREELEAEWEQVDPEGVAALRESAGALDRNVVQEGELSGTAAGVAIEKLSTGTLRTLAGKRKIDLGDRRTKPEILEALRAGK